MRFLKIHCPNCLFNVSDSLGIKLLTRLRLGLSHLGEHKFSHQKQTPEAFRKKRCSQKFRKIHRKTPVPESVNFVKFLRTPFLQNTFGRLLLNHNFQDTINPPRSCSLESESTTHFFLRCLNFTDLKCKHVNVS